MRRAYKFRLLPNKEQASFIDKTIGCSRLVYNLLLGNYKEQLENKEKPKLKMVTFFKNQGDYSFLKEVDSLALSNSRQNLENSLTNFYKSRKGLRKGRRMGFPMFHSKRRNKWRYTTNNQGNTIRIVENINLQGMSRGGYHLGKSIYDMGFGMFRSFLSYKCREEDSLIMYVPRYFPSSKMCHECGTINSLLKLSDREWVCTECGSILDRDRNASLNLRDYFYNVLGNMKINTVGTTGINASGEETSTLRFTLMQAASLKEEAPSFRWE